MSGVHAIVLIRPKQGILDPQGQTVERVLPALGFEGVRDVRIGRLVELEIDDPTRLDAICERLLANPLIEEYEIQVAGGGAAVAGGGAAVAGGGAAVVGDAGDPATSRAGEG